MSTEKKGEFKLFGMYLVDKGVITRQDVFLARAVQRRRNRRVSDIAVEMGFMTADQVEQVLIKQEECDDMPFGELAVEEGMLTRSQLDTVLSNQSESHVLFGEALVENRAVTMPQLIAELKEYNLEKLMHLGHPNVPLKVLLEADDAE